MQCTQSASSVVVPRLGKILSDAWHWGHSGTVPSAVCIGLAISPRYRRNSGDAIRWLVVQKMSRLRLRASGKDFAIWWGGHREKSAARELYIALCGLLVAERFSRTPPGTNVASPAASLPIRDGSLDIAR